MHRRLPHTSTHFAHNSNNEFWRAWTYQQWPIAKTQPKDEYGRERAPEYDYLDEWHVPTEYHAEGMALRYVETLRLSFTEIMDMMYSDFVRITLLHKAVTMRRPEKFKSVHQMYLDNTIRKHGL